MLHVGIREQWRRYQPSIERRCCHTRNGRQQRYHIQRKLGVSQGVCQYHEASALRCRSRRANDEKWEDEDDGNTRDGGEVGGDEQALALLLRGVVAEGGHEDKAKAHRERGKGDQPPG